MVQNGRTCVEWIKNTSNGVEGQRVIMAEDDDVLHD